MTQAETTTFIGVGSNLGDPETQIRLAVERLASIPSSTFGACSSLYRNPPMGPQDQPDYVNAVVRLTTRLDPRSLLEHLQSIEKAQGRSRHGSHWGPRTIDLDLLVYGERIIEDPGLHVPHPGIAERAFVLVPMAELDPDLKIPGHPSLKDLLARVNKADLVKTGAAVTPA